MHTCRMCDSPTHVLANCPKQPRSLTAPSTISKGPMGTRSYSSVLTNRGTDKTNRKAQEAEPIGGGQMPIAPIGDAVSFPELTQRPKMSTVVVLNKAPEDPISKPVEAESLLTPILTLKTLAVWIQTREFRDQQKQSKKRTRTASSLSSGEEPEEIESNVARLVEPGSPTREVPGSLPGVDTNSSPIVLGGGDEVPPDTFASGVPYIPSMLDQMDKEMDATVLVSVSNSEEDISFSDRSIQPGQRSFDRREANHVSETQESLGVPLGTPPTTITDKTLKAMEAVRRKKGHDKKTQSSTKPNFKF
ncbi:hypothetical protein GHT06_004528 [Daphnia sinensis]|uniref:Uncharacterized protein n=1 Tax=Daphnia sinensis TaxID=1820382 RepID=A0AAD5PLL6_9CRUS|nr:hypothetical protein GHT06_004528 [Daphnia sinensis]